MDDDAEAVASGRDCVWVSYSGSDEPKQKQNLAMSPPFFAGFCGLCPGRFGGWWGAEGPDVVAAVAAAVAALGLAAGLAAAAGGAVFCVLGEVVAVVCVLLGVVLLLVVCAEVVGLGLGAMADAMLVDAEGGAWAAAVACRLSASVSGVATC